MPKRWGAGRKMYNLLATVISEALGHGIWLMQCLWSQIDNREIASIVIVVGLCVFVMRRGNRRRIFGGLRDVIACALKPQILVPVLILIVYSCLMLWQMAQRHLWSIDLLMDSLTEIAFVGFPTLYIAVESHTVKSIVRRVILPEIGLSVLAASYIGIETFSLPTEIAVQLIMTMLILTRATCANDQRRKGVIHHVDSAAAVLSVLVFVAVTVKLIQDLDRIDWTHEMMSLFMSIWYPVLLLPFVIVLGYYAMLEKMFHRIRAVNHDVKWSELLFFTVEILPSLCCIAHFSGYEAGQCLEIQTQKGRREYCHKFRCEIKVRASEANAKIVRMESGKGKRGFDDNGLWLDWENLEKIKTALWTVANIQNGEWIKAGSYSMNIQNEMASVFVPAGCNAGGYVSDNGSVYICWMSNGTGFTFGMGASDGMYPPLVYEGANPPLISPGKPLAGFMDGNQQGGLVNWHANFYIDKSYQ